MVNLLDLLTTPDHFFAVNICSKLSWRNRCNLRLSCPRTCHAQIDASIACATFDMSVIIDGDEVRDPAWAELATQRAIYLARLPCLRALGVHSWEQDAHSFSRYLLCYSAASRPGSSSATTLSLDNGSFSMAGARAIRLALPLLLHLRLGCDHDELHYEEDTLHLSADLFMPLCSSPLESVRINCVFSWLVWVG